MKDTKPPRADNPTVRNWRSRVWPVVAITLLVYLVIAEAQHKADREVAATATQAFNICANAIERTDQDLHRVEAVMVNMLQQLGLDKNYMPLVRTLAFRKATGGARVSHSRTELNAPEVYFKGATLKDVAAPGWDGIGGPSE